MRHERFSVPKACLLRLTHAYISSRTLSGTALNTADSKGYGAFIRDMISTSADERVNRCPSLLRTAILLRRSWSCPKEWRSDRPISLCAVVIGHRGTGRGRGEGGGAVRVGEGLLLIERHAIYVYTRMSDSV